MNAAHGEFAGLYDSMSLRQPNAVDRTRISTIAREIVGQGMSVQGIASSVEDARKRGDQARGIGAVGLGVVGAMIGGPVGVFVGVGVGRAVGALFGPSIEDLKQVAVDGFRRHLNEAGEKLRRVGDACFDGDNELIEDLLADTVENQLGVYVKEVERVISVHEATIDTIRATKAALERSAGQARDWAETASQVARGVRAGLARSRELGTPNFSPVLDPIAYEALCGDAAGAVAAGGFRVPRALEQLEREAAAVGHGATSAQSDAIKSAVHLARFVNAVGAGVDEDVQLCLRDRQHFLSWGLSPLDLAIVLPVGPEMVDKQTSFLASASSEASIARIVDGLGTQFRHRHLRDLQTDVDQRFRFWACETPAGLLAGVARIDVELRQRARRRHLRLVLVGGAGAILGSLVVAAFAVGYRKAFPASDAVPQGPIGQIVSVAASTAPQPATAQAAPDYGVPCRINGRERQVKFRAGPSHGAKPTAIGKRGDEGRCYELVNGWRRVTTPDGTALGYLPEYLITWPGALGQGHVPAAGRASRQKVELKPKIAQDPEDLPSDTPGDPASQ